MTTAPTRRECLKLMAGAGVFAALGACRPPRPKAAEPVVLYTSADSFLVTQVTAAFTKSTGVHVQTVTDTEATKAAGLVQRLLTERASPRAEVWWSSEVMGTVAMAREGVLLPSVPKCLTEEFEGSWPGGLCDSGGLWWGIGQRARAVVFSESRVTNERVPTSLEDLAVFAPAGRVAIAQPQFGTTRTHFAWLVASMGEERARVLLERLKENCRVYPGNSAVVRAVAQGECDVGLTDTDDVWVGRASGWKLGASFGVGSSAWEALLIPNTVAMVGNARPRAEAQALVDFLCSADGERLLATSESRNVPVRATLRAELAESIPEMTLPEPAGRAVVGHGVDWGSVGGVLATADAVISKVFPL